MKTEVAMDVDSHDRPRKPKSGFAREKVKRLAAEARAAKAETKLRELEHAMSEVEEIEMQEVTPMSDDTPTPKRKSSGYRRLQGRHHELIELYENLMKDHTALTAKHEELQLDVQRLLEQHTRLMQAVRIGSQGAVGAYP
jgi:hypothetical protein